MLTILIIILVLMLIGAIPAWPHSKGWGYGPSGILTIVLVVLIVWLLVGGGSLDSGFNRGGGCHFSAN